MVDAPAARASAVEQVTQGPPPDGGTSHDFHRFLKGSVPHFRKVREGAASEHGADGATQGGDANSHGEGRALSTISAERTSSAWCSGCHAETDHQPDVDPTSRRDGLCRRRMVCRECGTVSSSTVEVDEGEYDRLRRRMAGPASLFRDAI